MLLSVRMENLLEFNHGLPVRENRMAFSCLEMLKMNNYVTEMNKFIL